MHHNNPSPKNTNETSNIPQPPPLHETQQATKDVNANDINSSTSADSKEQKTKKVKTALEEILRSHSNPVEAFFIIWRQRTTEESELLGKKNRGTPILIDEIILDARKDPVKADGSGGNLSAQILREEFDIDVRLGPDQQRTNSSKPHHKAYKDALEKAWPKEKAQPKKDDSEASFVEEFFKHHREERLQQCCTFTFWKGSAKEQATPLSIVKHSRRHWLFRIIPFFTYSGERSYQILKDKFGVDTRNSTKTSEDIAKELEEKVRAPKK